MKKKEIVIERTTDQGYTEKSYSIAEAVVILNGELENEKTIFIDSTPFYGTEITEEIIETTKKKICVTNKLVGG